MQRNDIQHGAIQRGIIRNNSQIHLMRNFYMIVVLGLGIESLVSSCVLQYAEIFMEA